MIGNEDTAKFKCEPSPPPGRASATGRTRGAAAAGLLLHALADASAMVMAALLLQWKLALADSSQPPQLADLLGPALVCVTYIACQPPRRALTQLPALALAITAVWLLWPRHIGAGALVGVPVGVLAQRLNPRPRPRSALATLWPATALLIALAAIAHPSGRAGASLAWTTALIMPLLALHLCILLVHPPPAIERWGEAWDARRRRRLQARGRRPLDPREAPVLYRRVERSADGRWRWEVRDGRDTVATGASRGHARAERAADHACWAHTFRAPAAKAPGTLYVLGVVDGNPFHRRVYALNAPPNGDRHARR